MGIIEKLKNALFEEEYIEVEETPKKVKRETSSKNEGQIDKPIAKKVVLAAKKSHSEDSQDRKQVEESSEINSRNVEVEKDDYQGEPSRVEEKRSSNQFKVIDEKDFIVDSEREEIPMNFEEDTPKSKSYNDYRNDQQELERVIYKQDKPSEKGPYGIDQASKNLVQDYGTAYSKEKSKTVFRPSPIISPIYGVLDKNYKKEDVVQKKDVRISSYSKDRLSVDEIRDKAYGSLKNRNEEYTDDSLETKKNLLFDDEDDNLLVDLNDNDKPTVKELTMGDAVEYFQDLGLEYNVDYVDGSKEKASGRRADRHYKDEENDDLFPINKQNNIDDTPRIEKILEDDIELNTKKREVKATSLDVDVESDDNLFDLIDSMYKDEEE